MGMFKRGLRYYGVNVFCATVVKKDEITLKNCICISLQTHKILKACSAKPSIEQIAWNNIAEKINTTNIYLYMYLHSELTVLDLKK